jgi:hypothetical protein
MWAVIVFAHSLPFASAQSETKEKEEINSLDDAKTIEDINKYLENVKSKSLVPTGNRNEDKKVHAKHLIEVGEAFIKGGEKIISLTDDPAAQEDGVQKKIRGFESLQYAELLNGQTGPNNPKTSKYYQQLEKYLEELEREGKHQSVVNQKRYSILFLNELYSKVVYELKKQRGYWKMVSANKKHHFSRNPRNEKV